MDESKKIKYIVIGSVSLLLLIVILLFVRGCSNMNKEKKASPITQDVSTSIRDNTQAADIAEAIGNSIIEGKDNVSQNTQSDFIREYQEQQDEEDAQRVQEALREQIKNKNTGSDYTNTPQPTSDLQIRTQDTIQHVSQIEQIKEDIRKAVPEEKMLPAKPAKEPEPETRSRFFSGKSQSSALPFLEVFGEQRIKNGDRLKLIAPRDMRVDNLVIPKGTVMYGRVSIQDRVNIRVENVRINGKMFAFHKNLIDNDGVTGINIGQMKDDDKSEAMRKSEEIVNAVPVGGGVAGGVLRTVSNSISVLFGKNKNEIEIIIQSNYKLFIQ